eukprot:101199-Rhodomonas_salina.1
MGGTSTKLIDSNGGQTMTTAIRGPRGKRPRKEVGQYGCVLNPYNGLELVNGRQNIMRLKTFMSNHTQARRNNLHDVLYKRSSD